MNVKTAKLNAEAQAAYDEFLSESKLAKEAFAHDRKKKAALKIVLEQFGDNDFAKLPDGRTLQRLEKTREVAASDARQDKWYELHEVAA